jgi:tRNA (guanosine-2'-O-)-methyltransferase
MTPERFARLKSILARRQPDLTVLMDRVHKPHNLSAVLRSCDAVGVLEVHAVPSEDYRMSRGVSAGAARYVQLRRHRSLESAVAALREAGMTLVAAHPDPDAPDFRAVDYARPTAVLLGTELEGLSDAALDAADLPVRIPMLGAAASLNVSVAAALILYEAQRQREAAGLYAASRLDPDRAETLLFEWAHPRVADLCRRRGVPYPALDEDGEIAGPVPR